MSLAQNTSDSTNRVHPFLPLPTISPDLPCFALRATQGAAGICLLNTLSRLINFGCEVGVPPLGGFVGKAFMTRPPKGGTPTL